MIESNGIIAIDAGHGFGDTGAVNEVKGVTEAYINYCVARLMVARLVKEQIPFFAVWETMVNRKRAIRSAERSELIRREDAWICLSVHCNAYEDSGAHGWEIWTKSLLDIALANCIKKYYLDLPFAMREEGVKRTNKLGLVGRLDCPTVLLELGFLTNTLDCTKLLKYDTQLKIVDAIMKGVDDFAKWENRNNNNANSSGAHNNDGRVCAYDGFTRELQC